MNDAALTRLAARIGRRLLAARLRVATAESCTAGWIAKTLTDVPGSSGWLDSGYVTYSNEAKRRALGVAARTLERFGAVSEQTVREMARGALRVTGVELAIAVSGIAGPEGGSPAKPVGTVWLCLARRRGRSVTMITALERFKGNRDAVRRKSVERALRLLEQQVASRGSSGPRADAGRRKMSGPRGRRALRQKVRRPSGR